MSHAKWHSLITCQLQMMGNIEISTTAEATQRKQLSSRKSLSDKSVEGTHFNDAYCTTVTTLLQISHQIAVFITRW
jgi:hypothetical protein